MIDQDRDKNATTVISVPPANEAARPVDVYATFLAQRGGEPHAFREGENVQAGAVIVAGSTEKGVFESPDSFVREDVMIEDEGPRLSVSHPSLH